MRRNLLALLITLALTAGLLWGASLLPAKYQLQLSARALFVPDGERARIGGPNGPVVTGLWQLSSTNKDFGSYSALILPNARTLLAISDRGRFLRVALPLAPRGHAIIADVIPGDNEKKELQDIESATLDPVSGRIWLGFEGRNAIMRTAPDFSHARLAEPPDMYFWPHNSGPESMTRLLDGRFIVLSEASHDEGWGDSYGLLFPGDPVAGAKPAAFSFIPPNGYHPSDIAILPDGRALILVRGVRFRPYPHFAARLLLADPAQIRAGKKWEWQSVAELAGPVPHENYEGLAVAGGADGKTATIWIISDDNQAKLIQRSLLVRLDWKLPPR